MLKSFEYVDPLLAQKIHNLEAELKKVHQSQQEILNNKKLSASTQDKLIKYQTECEKNIQKLLSEERDKLAEYLDQQTNVVTKTSRLSTSRAAKVNVTLNQSTKIDFSTTDDSRSLDVTKSQVNHKVSSFYVPATQTHSPAKGKQPNIKLIKMKRLKKKVSDQQKLIKMLVSWIKIYYQREQAYKNNQGKSFDNEAEILKKQNQELIFKCKRLQDQITEIRYEFKDKASSILQKQKKYDQIKNQNSGLKLERQELLNKARSLKKRVQS